MAAALAEDAGVPPARVDLARLQATLVADGVHLHDVHRLPAAAICPQVPNAGQ
jgi:hypothetical protein